MSMLTLNGLIHSVFSKPESKDKETGEIRPATNHAQILCDNVLESGEIRSDLVTLKIHDLDAFRGLVHKTVRVPVGAFVAQGKVQYYSLKTEPTPLH